MMHKQQNRLDIAGSFIAIACAVHCIAIPVIISFGGVGLLNVVGHGMVEIIFLLATILFAGSTIFIGFRQKRVSKAPIVLFLAGFVALCIAILFHLHFLSAIGGVLIALAHFVNWKYVKKHK